MAFHRLDRLLANSAGAGGEIEEIDASLPGTGASPQADPAQSEALGNAPAWAQAGPRGISATAAVLQSISAKVLIIGVNILTGILSARSLRPEGRGELAAMILWPVFLASVLSLGVPSALTFQLKRNPGKQSQLMGAALLLAILAGAVAVLLGGFFMGAWIPQYPPRVILFARL